MQSETSWCTAATENHGQSKGGSVLLSTAGVSVCFSGIAPVAQLDRALPSGGRGQRFESSRVRHRVCCCRTESMAHFSPSHCIQDFENERSGNLWSDLTQADCGKKSSGSRRESHVTTGYCGDSQHRTGQFFTTTCSCRVQSEVPWMKWRTVLGRPSTI